MAGYVLEWEKGVGKLTGYVLGWEKEGGKLAGYVLDVGKGDGERGRVRVGVLFLFLVFGDQQQLVAFV